eukprot:scaffold101024_cov52-Phaeocystis_antarctica.AAC.1
MPPASRQTEQAAHTFDVKLVSLSSRRVEAQPVGGDSRRVEWLTEENAEAFVSERMRHRYSDMATARFARRLGFDVPEFAVKAAGECCGASPIEPAEPAFTAKQLAKKKKEAKLIAKQLAKPSYWDKVDYGGPSASAPKAALADTVLVDAAWLARLADEGGVLPRCQDLPPGARVTLEEMEKWTDSWTVGVLVISYPWWAPPPSTLACVAPPV